MRTDGFMAMRIAIFIGWLFVLSGGPVGAATTYYVAPTGDDSSLGTLDQPWRTISQAAATLQAGDTVIIRGGTYNEEVEPANSGTAEAPITYQPAAGEIVILEGTGLPPSQEAFRLDGTAYIRLVGFQIRNHDESIDLINGAHHVEVEDCEVTAGGFGMWVKSGSNRITVRRVKVHHNTHGIVMSGGAHDILIEDSEAFGNDDGLGNNGDADGFAANETVTNITIRRSAAYNNAEHGFDLKAPGSRLERVQASGNGSSGLKLWGDLSSLENCISLANGGAGVSLSGFFAPGARFSIINCTITSNTTGLSSTTAVNVTLQNTILAFSSGPAIRLLDATAILAEDYNLLQVTSETNPAIVYRGMTYTMGAIRGGTWTASTGNGAHTLVGDPQFVDLAHADVSLLATSPALDAATSVGAPLNDFQGVSRPKGAGVDMGALEVFRFTIQRQVSNGTDDAWEDAASGGVQVPATSVPIGKKAIDGLRFTSSPIPHGAVVLSATLSLMPVSNESGSISIRYQGEASNSAAPFATASFNISSRPKTTSYVDDQPAPWVKGQFNRSPNLAPVIQEIINRPGWTKRNAIALFILDRGSVSRRFIEVVERTPIKAALLTVIYLVP